MKSNSKRIYWIARHRTGRVLALFAGKNAKRDATRADALRRPTWCLGAQLDQITR